MMKYLLFALVAIASFEGVASQCKKEEGMKCMKEKTDCGSAKMCYDHCKDQSMNCMMSEPSCKKTLETVTMCTKNNKCAAAELKPAIGEKCMVSHTCNDMKAAECVKTKVNCNDAILCDMHCQGKPESCHMTQPHCKSTIMVMTTCAGNNHCTDPMKYEDVIHERCAPKPHPEHPHGGAATLTGFVAMTVCYLAYLIV